ncbi:MAG: tRNA pseudouridine(55) synthase TruB [FCB group bacterium]|nr:tRNA pseudouridine(55) synthase TruB [FCB group bacterium]
MILNLYKPRGWTSFDVVKKVRNVTGEKKVGHGGTLDPFAEGLLIIGTGKDTKALTHISGEIKSYRGELLLGVETNTLDPEGQIVREAGVPELDRHTIQEKMDTFLGESQQTPPMFSAKKVNGTRLYKLARNHQIVERKPVTINLTRFICEEYNAPVIRFSVTCSKGTYIRVLGLDLARALGTTGHLTQLIRTRIGTIILENAISIEQFTAQWKSSAQ